MRFLERGARGLMGVGLILLAIRIGAPLVEKGERMRRPAAAWHWDGGAAGSDGDDDGPEFTFLGEEARPGRWAYELGGFGLIVAGFAVGGRLICVPPKQKQSVSQARTTAKPTWELTDTLLEFSKFDRWTIGDAVEGTVVLGATGSGKTSGSREMALSFLRKGFGGVVLTVKPDELALWKGYCEQSGRTDDLVVFGADASQRFNFLDYEIKRPGAGAGQTENVVGLITTILEVANRGGGEQSGREDEGYWRKAMRQLSRNLVDALVMAHGALSIPDLYNLLVSAPTSMEQMRSPEWRANSFCFQCLKAAETREKTARQKRDFELVAEYFLTEYPQLSDRTRTVIVSTFTSTIDVLNRGLLRELFCADTTITPEAIADGKILIINLGVKEFGEVGLLGQVIWKYCFQKAIERRDVKQNPRPVFLWIDEAQNFLTSFDQQFQTTARSARVATVLLSQNVSNFYAALGGNEKGRVEADALFANLNTKIFFGNSDPVTNEWAAGLIGRTRQYLMNSSNTYQPDEWLNMLTGFGHAPQSTTGLAETIDYELQPKEFTLLKTGGVKNDRVIEAILFQNGRRFKQSGKTWMRISMRQKRLPANGTSS